MENSEIVLARYRDLPDQEKSSHYQEMLQLYLDHRKKEREEREQERQCIMEERFSNTYNVIDIVATPAPIPDPHHINKDDGDAVRSVKQFYSAMRDNWEWFTHFWKETGAKVFEVTIEVLILSVMATFFFHVIALLGFSVWTSQRGWNWYEYDKSPYYVWVPLGVATVLGIFGSVAASIATIWLTAHALYYAGHDLVFKMPYRIARLIDRYGPRSNKSSWMDDFDI